MKVSEQRYFKNGKVWRTTGVWFDEIMQTIYINVQEHRVYDHKRMTTLAKYSIREKKFIIGVSMSTPQVVSILKEGTMQDVIVSISNIWCNYLEYALKQTNRQFVAFTTEEGSDLCVKEKLTLEQVMDYLGVTEEQYNQYIKEISPY